MTEDAAVADDNSFVHSSSPSNMRAGATSWCLPLCSSLRLAPDDALRLVSPPKGTQSAERHAGTRER